MTELDIYYQQTKPGRFCVRLYGSIDTISHERLEKKGNEILKQKPTSIILDMEEVQSISSTGLGTIFKLMSKCKQARAGFLVCNLRPSVRKVFDLVKTLPESHIFENLQQAEGHLDSKITF